MKFNTIKFYTIFVIFICFSYNSYSGKDENLIADIVVQKLVYICCGANRPNARYDMCDCDWWRSSANKESKKNTYAAMMKKMDGFDYEKELGIVESLLMNMDKSSTDNYQHVKDLHVDQFNLALDEFSQKNGFNLCRKINEKPKAN